MSPSKVQVLTTERLQLITGHKALIIVAILAFLGFFNPWHWFGWKRIKRFFGGDLKRKGSTDEKENLTPKEMIEKTKRDSKRI